MRALAVDGGGSSIRVAVANRDGSLAAHVAREGGMNPLDNPSWMQNLTGVLTGVDFGSIGFAVLGVPALGEVPDSDRMVLAELEKEIAVPRFVRNDVALAHYGAFAGGAGILVLSGTGSMAMAGTGGDPLLRTGGWGEELGDEGSAMWIGREALVLAARTADGRASAAAFRDALFGHLGLCGGDGLSELLGWYYGQAHRRSATAGLARFVDEAATRGDADAAAILDRAATHLSEHVNALRRRMPGGSDLPWSLAGGAFASTRLTQRLTEMQACEPCAPSLPPIGGGVLEAAREMGWNPDEAWIARLRDQLTGAAAAPAINGIRR